MGLLLLAVLVLQSAAPHLHAEVSHGTDERSAVETRLVEPPAGLAGATPDCIACLTSHQLRLGIVAANGSGKPGAPVRALRINPQFRSPVTSHLLEASSPRAPPA
jgi:hypothetical protein